MVEENWNNSMSMMNNLVIWKKKEFIKRLEDIQRHIYTKHNVEGVRRLEPKLHHEIYVLLKNEELIWFHQSRKK